MPLRGGRAGFTLLELMVALSVLALVSVLVYGAFSGLERTRGGLTRLSDRYHEGRGAMRRMAADLAAAYVSSHKPYDSSALAVETAFVGHAGNPASRVDFNAFSNYRFDADAHESDQAEISYFGAPSPEDARVVDLVRRHSSRLDRDPDQGGRIQVLATDIDLFELHFLDSQTGEWQDRWDSSQGLEDLGRLPLQVKILLILNEGARRSLAGSRQPLRFVTKVSLAMRNPLSFGFQ